MAGNGGSSECVDYKLKYEQSQVQVRKLVELSNRACQDYHILQKRFIELNKQHDKLKSKLQEKEELIDKLQNVSEAVCYDFNNLKTKYKQESQAIAINMKKASQWYHENKTLKRQSMILTQKMMSLGHGVAVDIDIDDEPDCNKNDENNEDLLQQNIDLKLEVQTINSRYESEVEASRLKNEKISELEETISQLQKVSELVVEEFNDLNNERSTAIEVAKKAVTEAQHVRKERNVLARKSAMLILENPPDEKLNEALLEIEKLSKELEDAKYDHEIKLKEMQSQLDENSHQEVEKNLYQKIEILEAQLRDAEERWHAFEKENEKYIQKVKELEIKLSQNRSVAPPAIPPPPPPPLPPSQNPIKSLMNIISSNKKNAKKKTPASKNDPRNDVINEMMAKIKKGNLHLKPAKVLTKEESVDGNGAVDEMMNILTSLKKSSNNSSLESVRSDESGGSELQRAFERRQKSPTPDRSPEKSTEMVKKEKLEEDDESAIKNCNQESHKEASKNNNISNTGVEIQSVEDDNEETQTNKSLNQDFIEELGERNDKSDKSSLLSSTKFYSVDGS